MVGGEQDGHALVDQLAHQGQDLRLVVQVQPGRRLVEHHDGGLRGDRSGDQDQLLLPTAEGRELALAQPGAADPLQGLDRGEPVRVTGCAEEAHLAGSAHEHHVDDAEGEGAAARLRDEADVPPGPDNALAR